MLSPEELKIRRQNIYSMLKNKRTFVKKYGKDAEKVMYSIATTQAQKKLQENTPTIKYRLSGKAGVKE